MTCNSINEAIIVARVIHLPVAEGKQNEFMEEMFRAYFCEEKTPCDRDVLLAAAQGAGLDMAKAGPYIIFYYFGVYFMVFTEAPSPPQSTTPGPGLGPGPGSDPAACFGNSTLPLAPRALHSPCQSDRGERQVLGTQP
jgi:hypothetical protein